MTGSLTAAGEAGPAGAVSLQATGAGLLHAGCDAGFIGAVTGSRIADAAEPGFPGVFQMFRVLALLTG